MIAKTWKSLNFGDRAGGQAPSMLILHYTGMKTEEEALERLCDPMAHVSAHYFVSETGEIFQLVEDDKRAWHAGASYWGGETDINSASIGIEIANPGHEFGYRDFPAPQIEGVIRLCQGLVSKYKIPPARVLAHSDVAPQRKEDPGELFPWHKLAAKGVGLWPKPSQGDFAGAETFLSDSVVFRKALAEYGYNPDVPFGNMVTAFNRHFNPDIFFTSRDPSEPDEAGAARLLALLRAKG